MTIFDLIPELYQINFEYNNIISSEEKEFESRIKRFSRKIFDNNFIATSDIEGIARFERLFNIKADETTESIEFRRERLYNRLASKPPYTERFLQQKLNEILGIDNWRYDIVYNDYTLDIYALRPGKLWLKELYELMNIIMPCNILWTIHIYSILWQSVYDNTSSWQDLKDKNLTWQQVMEGEWIENE